MKAKLGPKREDDINSRQLNGHGAPSVPVRVVDVEPRARRVAVREPCGKRQSFVHNERGSGKAVS